MASKVKKIGASMKSEMTLHRELLSKKNHDISQITLEILDAHESAMSKVKDICDMRTRDCEHTCYGWQAQESARLILKHKDLEVAFQRSTSAFKYFNL